MRIAILSDVHANAVALRSVLDDVDRQGVIARLCLGDSVGYGSDPADCLEILFEACDVVLAGNHDLAATGRLTDSRFTALARQSVEFARRGLSPRQRSRLAECADEERFGELLLVHASPSDPSEFPYIRDAAAAREQFDQHPFRIAFYGHTHVPLAFVDDGRRVLMTMAPRIELPADARVLCNAGSVGQPRDQDPRASYVIFDSSSRIIEFHRVEYDTEEAAARIRSAGLPEQLGSRLLIGV